MINRFVVGLVVMDGDSIEWALRFAQCLQYSIPVIIIVPWLTTKRKTERDGKLNMSPKLLFCIRDRILHLIHVNIGIWEIFAIVLWQEYFISELDKVDGSTLCELEIMEVVDL